MPTFLKLEITDEIIAAAREYRAQAAYASSHCPVALAIRQKLGVPMVWARYHMVTVMSASGEIINYTPSPECAAAMWEFDDCMHDDPTGGQRVTLTRVIT